MVEKEISLTQGDFIKVDGRVDIEKRVQYLTKRMHEWDYTTPLTIVLKPYFNPRSINQNALLHMWCREMSDYFIKNIPTSTPDNIKLMIKMKFLGLEDIKVGKTIIQNQVKHSSTLDKGEMVHFLDQVYHWARDNGVLLTVPSDSEYQKLKNQQVM